MSCSNWHCLCSCVRGLYFTSFPPHSLFRSNLWLQKWGEPRQANPDISVTVLSCHLGSIWDHGWVLFWDYYSLIEKGVLHPSSYIQTLGQSPSGIILRDSRPFERQGLAGRSGSLRRQASRCIHWHSTSCPNSVWSSEVWTSSLLLLQPPK